MPPEAFLEPLLRLEVDPGTSLIDSLIQSQAKYIHVSGMRSSTLWTGSGQWCLGGPRCDRATAWRRRSLLAAKRLRMREMNTMARGIMKLQCGHLVYDLSAEGPGSGLVWGRGDDWWLGRSTRRGHGGDLCRGGSGRGRTRRAVENRESAKSVHFAGIRVGREPGCALARWATGIARTKVELWRLFPTVDEE